MRENKLQPKGSAAKASTAARVATSALFVAGLAGLTSSAGTGCGRSSLEDAILDGGATVDARVDAPPPDAAACGPSTCPTGCCDASGVCRVGTDVQACGNLGGKCTDCVGSGFDTCDATRKACGKKVATCDATSCGSGCCVTTGGTQVCLPGTDALACGTGAGACVDCGSKGQACDPKLRVCGGTKCDATNCAGCCVGDKCQIGTDGTACGAKGQACENCTAQGTTCGALPGGGGLCEGIGRCGPMNCGGCCDARGTCTEGIDSTSCGRGGEACNDCTPRGQVCAPRDQPDGRTCVTPPACGPANCAGCCIGDVCTAGNQDTACGAAGGQCLNCVGTNQTCGAGGVCTGAPTCGPANCAGCCDGNTCVPGTAPATCGAGGQACRDCGAGTCNPGGTCSSPACSAANCPGCCQGDRCLAGFTNRACGSAGAACGDCTAAGTTCNTLAVPRVCGGAATCPAPYAACPPGVSQPVLPQNTNACSAAALSNASAACAGGYDTPPCVAYFAFLAATEPGCGTCMATFQAPFFDPNLPSLGKGLAACVSPFVNPTCLRNLGCAADCLGTSCGACPVGAGDACKASTTQPGGQCAASSGQAAQCAGPAILFGAAAFCNPATYGLNYGRWLQAVGTRFCGP